jgi:uncharacterized membrane protein YbhN (UPF0104 family)
MDDVEDETLSSAEFHYAVVDDQGGLHQNQFLKVSGVKEVINVFSLYLGGIVLCTVIEALLITGAYWVQSVQLFIIFAIAFALVCLYVWFSMKQATRVRQWIVIALMVAFFCSGIGGLAGGSYLRTYWFYENGKSFTGIDAGSSPTEFAESSTLSFSSAVVKADTGGKHTSFWFAELLHLSFHPQSTFCVAPLQATSASISFWAVAENCCQYDDDGVLQASCAFWSQDADSA